MEEFYFKPMSPKEFAARTENYDPYVNQTELRRQRRIQKENERDMEVMTEAYNNSNNQINRNKRQLDFLESVRKTLLSESIYQLFEGCICENRPELRELNIGRAMINNYVEEQTASALLNNYRKKNYLLSEFARIVDKYTTIVVETASKNTGFDDCSDNLLTIDPDTKKDFYQDLKMVNPDKVLSTIRDRVQDAMSDFIDDNTQNKIEIKDVIQKVQDKVDQNASDAGLQEHYMMVGKQKVRAIRNRPSGMVSAMVQTIGESAMKKDELRTMYVEGANLKMESVVSDVEVMYTVLEMFNTTGLADITEGYLATVLKDLSE